MEEDEDRELMKIRLETLQTMIGKLKKTSTSSRNLDNPKQTTITSSNPDKHRSISQKVHMSSKNSSTRFRYISNSVEKSPFESASLPKKTIVSTKPSIKLDAVNSKHKYVKPGLKSSKVTHISTADYVTRTTKNSILALNTSHKLVKATVGRQAADRKSTTTLQPSNKKSATILNQPPKQKRVINNKYSLVNIPENQTATTPSSKTTNAHRKIPQRTIKKAIVPVSSSTWTSTPSTISKYKIVNTSSSRPSILGQTPSIMNNTKQLQIKYIGGYTVLRRRFALIRDNSTANKEKKTTFHTASKYALYNKPSYPKKSFTLRRVKYLQKMPFTQSNTKVTRFPSSREWNPSPQKDILLKRHGSDFVVTNNMKSLQKIHESSAPPTKSSLTQHKNISSTTTPKFRYRRSNSKTAATSSKRLVASKLVRKNIMLQQQKKVNKTKYCLFYNRFGKCKRGSECRFIHDPNKVAVCTRFLHGTCTNEQCLFSHKVDPSKMPVCSYFLLDQCTRGDCPYLHVNVNKDAAICEDFLKGYCVEGEKCKKKHVLECPEFANTGKCKNRKTCILLHKTAKKKRRRTISGSRRPRVFSQKRAKLDGSRLKEDVEMLSPLRSKGKSHLLPKFINDKINEDSYDAQRVLSFSTVRNLFTMDNASTASEQSGEDDEEQPGPSGFTTGDTEDEYIPLTLSSEDEESGDDELMSARDRKFSMSEKDFISLE